MGKLSQFLSKKAAKVAESKPAEAPKEPSSDELQNEYFQLCTRIGNSEYQVWALEHDLKLMYERARDLNQAGAKAKQKEAEAAKAKAADEKKEEDNG